MAVHSNLDGTRRSGFTVGPGQNSGIVAVGSGDDREVALFDPIAGQATLTELLEGGGSTSIISHLVLNNDGGIVTDNDGEIVVDLQV